MNGKAELDRQEDAMDADKKQVLIFKQAVQISLYGVMASPGPYGYNIRPTIQQAVNVALEIWTEVERQIAAQGGESYHGSV